MKETLYEIHKLRFERDDDYVDAVVATLKRFKFHIYPDTWVDVQNPTSGQEALLKKVELYTPSAVFKNYDVAERRARLYYRAWTQCNMALAAFSLTKERRLPDMWLDSGQFIRPGPADALLYSGLFGVDDTLRGLWRLFARPEAIKKYGLVEVYPGLVAAIEWNYRRMKNAIKTALAASPKDEELPEAAEQVRDLIWGTTLDRFYVDVCGIKPGIGWNPDVPLNPVDRVLDALPDQVYVCFSLNPVYSLQGLPSHVRFYLNAWLLPVGGPTLGPVKGQAPAPKPKWLQGTAFHRAYLDFTKRINRIAMKLWNRYVKTEIPEVDADEPVLDEDLKQRIARAALVKGFGTSFPFCGTFAAQLPENLYVHLAAYLLEVPIGGPGLARPVESWIKNRGIPTMFEVREWYLLYKKTGKKAFLRKYRQGMRKILEAKRELAEGLVKTVRAYKEWKRLISELKLRAYKAVLMAVFAMNFFIRSVKRRVKRWAAWRKFCLATCYNIGVKRLIRADQLVERSLALRKAYEHIVRRKMSVKLTPKVNATKTFPKHTRDRFYEKFSKLLFKATLSTHFLKFEADPNNFERWEFDIHIGGAYPIEAPELDLSKWPPKGSRPKDLAQALKECGRGLKPPGATTWGRAGGDTRWRGWGLLGLLNGDLNRLAMSWEANLWETVQRERRKIKVGWSTNPLRELDVPRLQGEYLVRKLKG